VIAPFKTSPGHEKRAHIEEDLLNLLARRPCTLDDMSSGLQVHRNEILKYIEPLMRAHRIGTVKKGSEVYYQPKDLQ
jgi:predicted ArsR family transcriptional regulator